MMLTVEHFEMTAKNVEHFKITATTNALSHMCVRARACVCVCAER